MASIAQDFVGLRFSTPLIIGSGPKATSVGEIRKHVKEIAKNQWAGLVTKSMISKYGAEAKPHLWSSTRFRLLSMQNSGPALDEYSKSMIGELKKDIETAQAAGLLVLVSLIGSCEEEWMEMAGEAERAGADAIELNLSCPSRRPSIKNSMGGIRVGQNPEEALRAVQAAARGTTLPIVAKLTPHAPVISEIALACKAGNASAVSAINTVRGLIGIDIEHERPLSSDIEGRCYHSGLSGPLVKPIALGMVADIAMNTDIPISGIGGIVNWKDVVEFILAGASTVQVCTGVMWYGFGLGKRLAKGLEKYMNNKGYATINEFRGNALKPIALDQTPASYPSAWHVEISLDRCNQCRMCIIACKDASSQAIKEVDSALQIDRSRCSLCGLCMVVCKRGAISITK